MPALPDDSAAPHALVIDDEKNIRTMLSVCLEDAGLAVTAVPTASAALDAVRRQAFDLAFLDLRLAEANGMELIAELLAERPGLAIIVITAYATFETAVEAIKRGACDYIPKPFTPAQIRHAAEQAVQRQAMAQHVADLEQQIATALPDADLSTESPPMRTVLETITRAATADAPVFLRGESGTGKGGAGAGAPCPEPAPAAPVRRGELPDVVR